MSAKSRILPDSLSGLARWRLFLFIVAAYLATGEPALMLAESSGYATPVFPPAGIALAFCFVAGADALPAVFVGAFLLNFWIGFSKTFHFGATEVAAGFILAIASTLQSGAGGWLLRRLIGYPASFDKFSDLVRFLAVVPFVCLISASISTLTLYHLGAIKPSEYATGWGAWWMGDTLGVVTTFPLVLVAFGEPREIWRKRLITVALPMSIVFFMFVLVFLQTNKWEKGEALSEFRLDSQKISELLEAGLDEEAAPVETINAFMGGSGSNIERETFSRFCKDILSRHPAISTLEWISGTTTYVEPAGKAIDLASPALRDALKKAGKAGKYAAFPAPDGLMVVALKSGRNMAVLAFSTKSLLPDIIGNTIHARLREMDSGRVLYDTFPAKAKTHYANTFEFGGRRYALETAPTSAYLKSHLPWQSWAILVAGILASGILGAFLLLGTGYTARIEREVETRTNELRQSEARYKQMFETNAAVKLVVDPDSGMIAEANQAAERFYGYSRRALLAMKIDEINVLPSEDIKTSIAKAMEAKCLHFEFKHRLASGELRDVEVYSGPIELGGKTMLYSIVHDITDRKLGEASLRRFTSIFGAISEGVMVVDSENTIVEVNPAFTEITGYIPEDVIGKTPQIMKSGRHDDAFYREMWLSLQTYGRWQGEIWDKRKNGEIFPEWLTINTIYDEQGNVRERVALFSDITKKKEAEEQVWRQANFDELTGLPNRSMFRDRLEFEIRKAVRSGASFALLFIDLDRFKEVNDTLGHETGDKLLVEAANRIVSTVRESDTVARLGGDEFTVILSDLGGNAHVETIASTIIQKLAEPFHLNKESAYVSGSIGITLYPSDAQDSSELLKNADQAMYVAKSLGKNRFAYFTPELQEAAVERMRLIGELRNALLNGELHLAFQPIVSVDTGDIVKAEALLRWTNLRRGAVSPTEFIPLAEETGLIHEIGDWVFRETAVWAKRWQEKRENFQVSFNVSPIQLMVQSGGHAWLNYLKKIGLPGKSLVVEITEGVLLNATQVVTSKLEDLRNAGIRLAIDDFGTGYSALGYLKKFDIDYLKIDRSFISEIEREEGDLALARAIVAMAHSLAMEVVAEGVETEGQKAALPVIRCDFAQGYLFAKPLTPEAFEALL
jgi:diguanylate cyclase (GGDEF)-like protein/PAS domain S-box-containing protein